MKDNKLDEALKLLDQHLEENPDDHEALHERAKVHLALKNYDKAIEDANKSIELNPTGGKAYGTKATALICKGSMFKGVQALKTGAEHDNSLKNKFAKTAAGIKDQMYKDGNEDILKEHEDTKDLFE